MCILTSFKLTGSRNGQLSCDRSISIKIVSHISSCKIKQIFSHGDDNGYDGNYNDWKASCGGDGGDNHERCCGDSIKNDSGDNGENATAIKKSARSTTTKLSCTQRKKYL